MDHLLALGALVVEVALGLASVESVVALVAA